MQTSRPEIGEHGSKDRGERKEEQFETRDMFKKG